MMKTLNISETKPQFISPLQNYLPTSAKKIGCYVALLFVILGAVYYAVSSLKGRAIPKPPEKPPVPVFSLPAILEALFDKLKKTPLELEKFWNVYTAKYKPQKRAQNISAYFRSPAFGADSKTACVYHSKKLSTSEAMVAAAIREPVNLGMKRHYDQNKLLELVGYKVSAYCDPNCEKEDGASFSQEPTTVAIYSETIFFSPKGQDLQIACLSVSAPALDSKDQPHYKLYADEQGRLNVELYQQQMDLLFKMIEKAVRDHAKTAFEGQGIKRIMLSKFGQDSFLDELLELSDRDLAHDCYKKSMKAFMEKIKDLDIPVVMSEYLEKNDQGRFNFVTLQLEPPYLEDEHCVFGDFINHVQKFDFIVNPADYLTLIGNGNDGDRSFDGGMGANSGVMPVQTPLFNPTLRDPKAYIAVD